MPRLSFKIAFPIIIAGFFIMVAFIAVNYESLNVGFYSILFLLVVYIFLFGFAIGQNFASPIKKLLERADDLSKGDLKSRFYSESKDEIGQLSNVFNKIADKLEESHSETEKTEKSVGIRVEAETQSLKEIINDLERKVQNRTLEFQRVFADLEKFREYSKAKEIELTALKNQVLELKTRLERHGVRKNKALNQNEKTFVRAGREKLVGETVNTKTQSLKETINNLERKVQNRTLEFQRVAGDLEKFQKYSKKQEEEILKLENQINRFIKKSEKNKVQKNKILK